MHTSFMFPLFQPAWMLFLALLFAAHQGRKGSLAAVRLGHRCMQELKTLCGIRGLFKLVTTRTNTTTLHWHNYWNAVGPTETLLKYSGLRPCPFIHNCPCKLCLQFLIQSWVFSQYMDCANASCVLSIVFQDRFFTVPQYECHPWEC